MKRCKSCVDCIDRESCHKSVRVWNTGGRLYFNIDCEEAESCERYTRFWWKIGRLK